MTKEQHQAMAGVLEDGVTAWTSEVVTLQDVILIAAELASTFAQPVRPEHIIVRPGGAIMVGLMYNGERT